MERSIIRKNTLMLSATVVETYLLQKAISKPRRRRVWVHPIFKERETKSEFILAEALLDSGDPEKCFQYFRMSKEKFLWLLALVESKIAKENTNWRSAITPKQRLIITIRYLATGASQIHISFSFRLGHTTVGLIIKECCQALWDTLQPLVLKPPTAEKWLSIANDFHNLWQCSNCIGAIDGKHIRIKAPPNSGSEFYNYKGYFSLVLLAICDANYRFVLVDIGDSGRHSDGGVFSNSSMGKKFDASSLDIPPPANLPGSDVCAPFYFAADDAFPLKVGMIKPYPGRGLDENRQIFNYRLSRGRRVVENAFGILAVRWQVFYKMISCDPATAQLIVQACVVLHNLLQNPEPDVHTRFVSGDKFDRATGNVINGSWRSSISPSVNLANLKNFGSNFYGQNAGFFRDQLKSYFLTRGAVSWQWNRL